MFAVGVALQLVTFALPPVAEQVNARRRAEETLLITVRLLCNLKYTLPQPLIDGIFSNITNQMKVLMNFEVEVEEHGSLMKYKTNEQQQNNARFVIN